MKFAVAVLSFATAALAATSATNTSAPTTPTGNSTTGVPTKCISDCGNAAAVANGCKSFADVSCVCTNAQFQADVASCLAANCPNDLTAALALQTQACGTQTATGAVKSTPFTNTAGATNTAPNGPNATGNTTTNSTTPGGNNNTTPAPGGATVLGAASALAGVVAVAGMLVGSGLLL